MTARNHWMLYGATGYTGRHIAESAVANGYRPLLAGRRKEAVKALADRLGLEWCVVDLNDPMSLKSMISDCSAVMLAAGPFAETCSPMIEACIAKGTHYLDIAAEVGVFEQVAAMDGRLRAAGIMAMTGCGFDMVPGDCLSLSLKRRMPDATELSVAVGFEGTLTRGTIRSTQAAFSPKALVRRGHRLLELDAPQAQEFDFGRVLGGKAVAHASTFGDVSVSWRSTGIPNVTTFMRPAKSFEALMNLKGPEDVERLPEGPSHDELENLRSVLLGEVRNDAGQSLAMRLEMPQVYKITFELAAEIAQRVHEGTWRQGFQTPAGVFGEEFILELDGCSMEPWPSHGNA